jgi:hypothetical protein
MAVLGVIADDFTGATDIAGMLVKGGMRSIQTIGVPAAGAIPDDVDAAVVALKSRSIPANEAIALPPIQPGDILPGVLRFAVTIGSSRHSFLLSLDDNRFIVSPKSWTGVPSGCFRSQRENFALLQFVVPVGLKIQEALCGECCHFRLSR